MTPERQNEIWSILTQLEKEEISKWYSNNYGSTVPLNVGFQTALSEVFGKHNLTSQAEEKPKEPRFKKDDVLYVVNPKHPLYNQRVRLDRWIADGKFWLVIDRSCGLREIKESDLALYTEPTDETTQKSPSHGENERNLHVSEREMTQESPSEQNRSLSQDVADCDIETEEEEAMLRMEYIAMMEEKKVELEKLREQMNDRYFQYRLDLTKEIAVAMIKSHNEPVLRSIAEVVVDTTNYIVKRLKETEI